MTPTVSSMIDIEKSQGRIRKYSDVNNSKNYNSIFSEFSNSRKEVVPEEEDSIISSSPERGNYAGNYDSKDAVDPNKISFGPTNNKEDSIFTCNNWKKNLKDLTTVEVNVNASIVQGPEESSYLKDVKLEHLDKLGR
jgi:hypothetical protein